MRPVDAITLQEAARILGAARSTVQEWVRTGILPVHGEPGEKRRLSQADVEHLACTVLRDPRGRANEDPESYWVWGSEAAEVLGVSAAWVRILATEDKLPYLWHVSGVRLYRRAQLEVLARR